VKFIADAQIFIALLLKLQGERKYLTLQKIDWRKLSQDVWKNFLFFNICSIFFFV